VNLEAIAMRRAEEQLESEAWRDAEPAEYRVSKAVAVCLVCSAEFPKAAGANKRCPACRAAGWSVLPCKGCGGRLRELDRYAVRSTRRRGYCQACRAGMPQEQKGAETIAKARAAKRTREAA
jgi:hypothetical protein